MTPTAKTLALTAALWAATAAAAGPRGGKPGPAAEFGGLGFRARADDDAVVLHHNAPRLPLATYRGETDRVLAVTLPGASGRPTPDGDATVRRYAWPDEAGSVTVSRLSPAVLVRTARPRVRLNLALPPSHAAIPRGGRVAVVPSGRLGEAFAGADGPAWLLLWFAPRGPLEGFVEGVDVESELGVSKALFGRSTKKLDLPVLVRFAKPAASAALDGKGRLTLAFGGAGGSLAVMPLTGGRLWLPAETARWADGLPAGIAAACKRWSALLGHIPVGVRETVAAGDDANAVSFRQRFEWASLDDAPKAAPLPPMLATALGGGMEITFSAGGRQVHPVDANWMDTAGPLAFVEGADGYTVRIGGLDGLIALPPRKPVAAAEAAPWRAKLRQRVGEMVAAGHLRPLLYIYGGIGGTWFSHIHWGRTADLAVALDEAAPHLPADLRERAVDYLRREWAAYPALAFDEKAYREGTNRAPYDLPAEAVRSARYALRRQKQWRTGDYLSELHGVDAYLRLTGDRPDAALKARAVSLVRQMIDRLDWSLLAPPRLRDVRDRHAVFYYNLQGGATLNRWLAGTIGFTRTARREGWAEADLGLRLAAKLALARVGVARYLRAAYAAGLVRGRYADDNRALIHIDTTCALLGRGPVEFGVHQNQELPPFCDLSEEVGRLLGRFARGDCARYLAHLDRSVPLWWISEAPKQQGTEHRTCPLQHYDGNVRAHAWVLGRRGRAFTRYVDTSRFVGDLYLIRNLAAACRAGRER